jgi:hypothetical protein
MGKSASEWVSLPFSRFVPAYYYRKGMKRVVDDLRHKYPHDYLVCIGYKENVQLGLSETAKTTDTKNNIVSRALYEELCIELTSRSTSLSDLSCPYPTYEKTPFNFGIHHASFRIDHPSQVQTIVPTSQTTTENDYSDRRNSKVVIYLHGPEEVMKKAFSVFRTTEVGIERIVLVPLDHVTEQFPFLQRISPPTKHNYHKFHKFHKYHHYHHYHHYHNNHYHDYDYRRQKINNKN